MNKLKLWQFRFFYLTLFLLPANLAKHFPLKSSYINGILVDYLIPTVYLTDILIILLLVLWLIQTLVNLPHKNQPIPVFIRTHLLRFTPIILFLILLLPSIISSTSPIVGIYKWLKFLELSLFAFWISYHLNLKVHFNSLIQVITLSVAFQSLLALTQWFKQSSVFSYFFFGEQPFNQTSFGIDKITWFDGSLKVPPLGTFPHPNVLAGFLAVSLTLILFYSLQKSKASLFHSLSFSLGLITLFLTFSLSSWLAFLLIGLPAVVLLHRPDFTYQQRTQQLALIKDQPRFAFWQQQLTQKPSSKLPTVKLITIFTTTLLLLLILSSKLSFLAPESSFTRRSQLASISLQMFKTNPLTGVGLNNFTLVMNNFGFISASTRFLQPVHNIYLLILSETGLIGLTGFILLILSPLFKLLKSPSQNPYSLIVTATFLILLFIGLFDHYPLTIHQSSLLFFISLNLSS